jgi:hypothetical protein
MGGGERGGDCACGVLGILLPGSLRSTTWASFSVNRIVIELRDGSDRIGEDSEVKARLLVGRNPVLDELRELNEVSILAIAK